MADARAEERKLLMGDPAPDAKVVTTYVQFRVYDRDAKAIKSVPGLSATFYDYSPEEVFTILKTAMEQHNARLIEAREARRRQELNTEAEGTHERHEEDGPAGAGRHGTESGGDEEDGAGSGSEDDR